MGLGFAAYQSTIFITGTASAAEASVGFVGRPHVYAEHLVARPKEEKTNQPASPMQHDIDFNEDDDSSSNAELLLRAGYSGDKTISTTIENAYPGDIYKVQYTVENTGTIPVVFTLESLDDSPEMQVANSLHRDEQLRQGESLTEELTITIAEDLEEAVSLEFSLDLTFRQWNTAD